MADNYLEKRMEDMRNGKLAHRPLIRKTEKQSTSFLSKGSLANQRVLIMEFTPEIQSDIISLFRSQGCKVAFLGEDYKKGQMIAQATGARFYPINPVDPEDKEDKKKSAIEYWGGIDIIISGSED